MRAAFHRTAVVEHERNSILFSCGTSKLGGVVLYQYGTPYNFGGDAADEFLPFLGADTGAEYTRRINHVGIDTNSSPIFSPRESTRGRSG